MHDAELMMAVIVASTALTGLAGVVMGQITKSELTRNDIRWSRWVIVFSFLLSVLAVLSAMVWFRTESLYCSNFALGCFGGQLALFSSVASAFWLVGE